MDLVTGCKIVYSESDQILIDKAKEALHSYEDSLIENLKKRHLTGVWELRQLFLFDPERQFLLEKATNLVSILIPTYVYTVEAQEKVN